MDGLGDKVKALLGKNERCGNCGGTGIAKQAKPGEDPATEIPCARCDGTGVLKVVRA